MPGTTNAAASAAPAASFWSANRNVWSAALSQAKNEGDRLVCANVYGLGWRTKLLALMERAAPSSLFSEAVLKDFSGLQVSRAPGSTVVSSHDSPANLAGKFRTRSLIYDTGFPILQTT